MRHHTQSPGGAVFAIQITAEGVVTSTNGEPVPDNPTTEES